MNKVIVTEATLSKLYILGILYKACSKIDLIFKLEENTIKDSRD